MRPEHLTLGGPLEARVSVIEPTGSETQVFATVAGHRIVGVFRERIATQPGDVLKLSAPPTSCICSIPRAVSGWRDAL